MKSFLNRPGGFKSPLSGFIQKSKEKDREKSEISMTRNTDREFEAAHQSLDETQYNSTLYMQYDLFSLARNGRNFHLEKLLRAGVDPNSCDENGNTIFIIACQNGNKNIAKIALRFGADINSQNHGGNTGLHYCYEYKYTKLAEYLISKGANPDLKNGAQVIARDGIKMKKNLDLMDDD